MASSQNLTSFRLATLNVHSFRHPTDRTKTNLDDLVSILKPLNLDFIGVQEIQKNNKWMKFCEEMSLPYSIYGPSNGNTAGNGIASSRPIHFSLNQQSTEICQGGTRAFLQCSLQGLEEFKLGVTHLDHLDEDVRLAQINEFNPNKQNLDLILGDFNALTREDYSNDYYQNKIVQTRNFSSWEKPRFHLTELIRDQWNYQDVFQMFNPQLKDEEVATSRFGSRIDYIYLHPRINNRWILNKCHIIDTKGSTDHSALFAQFELTSI